MRQSGPQRRGRGRPSGRRGYNNSPNRSYDSSGPEVKIRGTASTVHEKYQTLARDALTSGDRVAAENYFQHAEHYYRVMQATKQQQTSDGEQRNDQRPDQRNDQRGEQRPDQRDNRGRGQQNRGGRDDEAAADSSDDAKSLAEDDAAAEVAVEMTQAEELTPESVEVDLPARGEDGPGSAPMNPADLAAMSGSGRNARDDANNDANGANGQDSDAAEQPAPRRQPRRRRRPTPPPEAAVDEAAETAETAETMVTEAEEAPAPVVEDVETS